MRESVVEKYLHQQVEARGGTTRKMKGRINDCDRLVIWPIAVGRTTKHYKADVHLVEVKAPGKKPRPGQVREHARLRELGCTVVVIDSKPAVDAYVRNR